MLQYLSLLAATVVLAVWLNATRIRNRQWELAARRSQEKVSIIIPALNEAKALQHNLEWLRYLSPPPHEIIVVDGDSSDSTVDTSTAGGAKVVQAARGRAIQMNAGAAAATGDLLCFMHADSQPPPALVHLMRRTLADPATVVGGFRTLICGSDGRLLKFMTAHHLVKSYYLVFLARPLMWLRGGLCLFGDQSIFCRAVDFHAVSGYDESLPIMEDVQLCISMHEAGPATMPIGGRGPARGRVRQIWWPPAYTSGRRLEALGNFRATQIHFTIGLGWYLGISRRRLFHLYKMLYSDSYR